MLRIELERKSRSVLDRDHENGTLKIDTDGCRMRFCRTKKIVDTATLPFRFHVNFDFSHQR